MTTKNLHYKKGKFLHLGFKNFFVRVENTNKDGDRVCTQEEAPLGRVTMYVCCHA